MAEWPTSLPALPLRQGYEEQIAETRVRTEMDAGPAKMRRRFQAGMDTITLSFEMTSAQIRILETFYKNTLEGGTLEFDYVHPREGEQRAFRFVEPPKWGETAKDIWVAQTKLEFVGSTEALAFVDLDFGLAGNSGYIPLFEDI